ncbi:MAG: DNA double-strand break repair nuclease NurA [Thermomicrobiales bacterium]
MTLDLALIAGQIAEMVDEMESDDLHHRFNVLRDTWQRHDGPELADRLTNGRSTFMLPAPQEDYSSKRSLPEGFDSYAIAATDGSFILPSRHNPARYYLLNTGRVLLEYGEPPRAMLDSKPELRFREEDLAIGSPVHNIPVNGSTIGPKRAAEELREAADLLGGARSPAVALQDGTLILWSLETLPEPVAAWTLPPFLKRCGGSGTIAFRRKLRFRPRFPGDRQPDANRDLRLSPIRCTGELRMTIAEIAS